MLPALHGHRGDAPLTARGLRKRRHSERGASGGRWARSCSWTARKPSPTGPWMCRAWGRTSSLPRGTRCAGPPASASSGAGARCMRSSRLCALPPPACRARSLAGATAASHLHAQVRAAGADAALPRRRRDDRGVCHHPMMVSGMHPSVIKPGLLQERHGGQIDADRNGLRRTCTWTARHTRCRPRASSPARRPSPRPSAWARPWTTSAASECATFRRLSTSWAATCMSGWGLASSCAASCPDGLAAPRMHAWLCMPPWRVWSSARTAAQLRGVNGVTIYGPPAEKRGSPLASFTVDGIHATDLSTFLDFEGAPASGGRAAALHPLVQSMQCMA